jgi:hypothetical protein
MIAIAKRAVARLTYFIKALALMDFHLQNSGAGSSNGLFMIAVLCQMHIALVLMTVIRSNSLGMAS